MLLRAFWLRLLGGSLVAAAFALSCGSPEFTAGGPTGGTGGTAPSEGGDSGTVGAGTGGTAGGGTTLCTGTADCDDQNPCTIDSCSTEGVCAHDTKCTGNQPFCCDGLCGACCAAADCADGVDCTDDVCFAGFCTNPPNDASCGPDAYCGPSGCMPREECQADTECDDGDACTADTCTNGFCDHPLCPNGGTCCPGTGCGACCIDAQCSTADDDPCLVNVCNDGVCGTMPLCADTELCCPNTDRSSATCGSCCTAKDCPDDGVDCTQPVCTGGHCSTQVVPGVCAGNATCDPLRGCVSGGECKSAADCPPPASACESVHCQGNQCEYGGVSCEGEGKCCPNLVNSGGPLCRECCDNRECDTGTLCCQADGACHACCADSDCPPPKPGGGLPIIGATCQVPVCLSDHTCGVASACQPGQVCCNGTCQSSDSLCVGL